MSGGTGSARRAELRWCPTSMPPALSGGRFVLSTAAYGRPYDLRAGRVSGDGVTLGPVRPVSAGVEGAARARWWPASPSDILASRAGQRRMPSPPYENRMNFIEMLASRRSIREFTSRPVTREEVERLLQAAVCAPNHRLTEPWRFYVLGPQARHAFGLALGNRKARKLEDAEAAERVRQKVADEHAALPLLIAVAIVQNENPEIREEDYAAGMMAVENLSLAAIELGLGTHIKSGAVMDDPAARAAIGVADGERVIALVNVGEPATVPPPKNRRPATDVTTWVS